MTHRLELKHTLDELAEQAVPEGVNLWPAMQARTAQAAPTRGRLPRRAAWAGLALAALLALGATAYAAAPVLSRLLTMDDQFRSEDAQRLGTSLNLSQTAGDVTVTVQWAYADQKRVLVGYAIQTADGRRFDPGEASLTDARGTALHASGGYGVTGQSDLLGVSLPPGQSSNVAIYDSPAGAQTQTLHLHLRVTAAEYDLPAAPTAVSGGNSGPSQSITAEAQPAVLLATAGPFDFDFEVPVIHSQ